MMHGQKYIKFNSECRSRDSNRAASQYQAQALPLAPTCAIINKKKVYFTLDKVWSLLTTCDVH